MPTLGISGRGVSLWPISAKPTGAACRWGSRGALVYFTLLPDLYELIVWDPAVAHTSTLRVQEQTILTTPLIS